MKRNTGWIGVDLDGTLAKYDGFIHATHIGEPIQPMVERIQQWIANGYTVKIFTARVTQGLINRDGSQYDVEAVRTAIQDYTEKHIGHRLEVTNVKDFSMIELWDDRAVRVAENTGMPCCSYERSR